MKIAYKITHTISTRPFRRFSTFIISDTSQIYSQTVDWKEFAKSLEKSYNNYNKELVDMWSHPLIHEANMIHYLASIRNSI